MAYVSSDDALAFRAGDTLVIDASNEAISSGQTSALALQAAFERGTTLFSDPSLHAKAFVLGGVAIVGSANLSQSSRKRLHELAVVTDDPEVVGGVAQFVTQLAASSTRIDQAFIERILTIPVTRSVRLGKVRLRKGIRIRGGRTWILGLSEDAVYPGDTERVELVREDVLREAARGETADWFWWPVRRTRFSRLAREGDRVITLYRPRQSNRSTRSVTIYRHAVIRRIFNERNCSARTYHCISRPDAEKTALEWSRFVALARGAGVYGALSVDSARQITAEQATTLNALWPAAK